ncbi:hypothetical protein SKAU_G00227170 [Synaphobranchus kaupii]|uniref:Uncharacterized protein n=1 Tax=Synaphobranchus kaupii TaxID=118154 RepID=A0A9Q1F4W0_SYNKA|nr:hypothetical protein SKAU_G00227170 [Synaphobranchus kaupii]
MRWSQSVEGELAGACAAGLLPLCRLCRVPARASPRKTARLHGCPGPCTRHPPNPQSNSLASPAILLLSGTITGGQRQSGNALHLGWRRSCGLVTSSFVWPRWRSPAAIPHGLQSPSAPSPFPLRPWLSSARRQPLSVSRWNPDDITAAPAPVRLGPLSLGLCLAAVSLKGDLRPD